MNNCPNCTKPLTTEGCKSSDEVRPFWTALHESIGGYEPSQYNSRYSRIFLYQLNASELSILNKISDFWKLLPDILNKVGFDEKESSMIPYFVESGLQDFLVQRRSAISRGPKFQKLSATVDGSREEDKRLRECVDAILAEQPAGTEMKKDAAVQKAAELLSMPYTPSLTQRYYREKRRQEKRERQDEEFQQMMSKYQVKLPLNLD